MKEVRLHYLDPASLLIVLGTTYVLLFALCNYSNKIALWVLTQHIPKLFDYSDASVFVENRDYLDDVIYYGNSTIMRSVRLHEISKKTSLYLLISLPFALVLVSFYVMFWFIFIAA